jgi:hypothetical protein
LADALSLEAQRSDENYILAEEAGQAEESQQWFRRMCTLNGLSHLFSTSQLNLRTVDDIIYDLGHGAPDIDAFGEQLLRLVSKE